MPRTRGIPLSTRQNEPNMPDERNNVAVIIAAWNAQATIGRAIQSALDQPEVSEVVVVNDGSTDGTELSVRAAIAANPRVALFSVEGNKGPAVARNIGIARTTANHIAVLDADDYFLPARFKQIFEVKGWDAIADNIAFVPEGQAENFDLSKLEFFAPDARTLSLAAFVAGNISRPGKGRAELGFVKPVIRRGFIEQHRIRYDESLRLGEDYAFYAQMLSAGANFLTIKSCGYVAIERENSLSGKHSTADLSALLQFDRRFESLISNNDDERIAILQHRAQLEAKVFHREILDVRQAKGRLAALVQALAKPAALPRLATSVLRDKFYWVRAPEGGVRYLL